MKTAQDVRILVLEDDRNMLDALCDVLLDEGYQVDPCWRGEQAVDFARKHSYDLLISDIRMEGLDGLGALSEVQSYLPDVGSLVVTGYATDTQTDRASRLSFNALLKKPFDLSKFLKSVEDVLSARQSQLDRKRLLKSELFQTRWVTDWVAELLSTRSPFPFLRLVETTRFLCGKLGLTWARTEQMAVAALSHAATQRNVTYPLPSPEELDLWLEASQEHWDGAGPRGLQGLDIPLESRVLSASYWAVEQQAILTNEPARFDPNLLDFLDQMNQPEEEAEETRGLLDVARALAAAGDVLNAQKALQEVVSLEAASPSGVEAMLELAKLKQCLGDAEEAQKLAGLASEVASHVGPHLAAETGLQGALLLAKIGQREKAAGLLESSVKLFDDLGLSARSHQCRLAISHVCDRELTEAQAKGLEELLQPANRSHLLESLEWLLPLMLKMEPQDIRSQLGTLLEQFPQASLKILSAQPKHLRRRAVETFKGNLTEEAGFLLESLDQNTPLKLSASTPSKLSLKTLGRFELINGASKMADSSWKTSKVKYLLCLLAANQGPVNEDLIIEQFWPGDLRRARKNLQANVSYLRKALRDLTSSDNPVEKQGASYSLSGDLDLWHDLTELRQSAREARRHRWENNAQEAAPHYKKVFQLYTGPYLESCYQDWAVTIRTEVEDAVLEACLLLANQALEEQRFEEALECSKKAFQIEPDLAEATSLIMRSYVALQRPAAAIREFETHKRVLATQFETTPSVELERLHIKAKLCL